MKMMYNGTPIKSLNIKHYEISTNDCDMIASDLQVGKTAVARGKKITGTGKSFEFATYGGIWANEEWPIPSNKINVVHINCLSYPTQSVVAIDEVRNLDFSTPKIIGNVTIDSISYPIKVSVIDSIFTIICEKDIKLEVFYGKDNYV